MSVLYLAWRQPGYRWWPIGRLTRQGQDYEFAYTRGAVEAGTAGFRPLLAFPERNEVYRSETLFPVFANRVMNPSRPEFRSYLEWLALPPTERDPLVLLARNGGRRETDVFEVFAAPEPSEDGRYRITFFVHGLRHRPPASQAIAEELRAGERLEPRPDPENPSDPEALAIFARGQHVGFAPRYLRSDLRSLEEASPGQGWLTVVRVNPTPTPMQFRVLASYEAPWPERFRAFSEPAFEPLRSDLAAVA